MLDSNNYTLEGFRISTNPKKKYDAILRNNNTKRIRYISFGSKNASQFYDKLGHYKEQDNLDTERRRLYRLRHQHDNLNSYSPGYFSWTVLW